MQAEFESLEDNNTWRLVREPKDRKVLPGKWVYKVKYGADGQIDKYKARYVAKGLAQVEGLDFSDTIVSNSSTESSTSWSNGCKISLSSCTQPLKKKFILSKFIFCQARRKRTETSMQIK